MKKSIILAALFLFSISSVFASPKNLDPKINFDKVSDLSFKVNFENAKGQKATIKLIDENGKLIYQEVTSAEKTLELNLVNPVDGEYKIIIEINKEKLSYEFVIE